MSVCVGCPGPGEQGAQAVLPSWSAQARGAGNKSRDHTQAALLTLAVCVSAAGGDQMHICLTYLLPPS